MPVIEKEWMVSGGYVKVPLQDGAAPAKIRAELSGEVLFEGKALLSEERVDRWAYFPIKRRRKEPEKLTVRLEGETGWLDAPEWQPDTGKRDREERPYFHFTPLCGELGSVSAAWNCMGSWSFQYSCIPFLTSSSLEIGPEKGQGTCYRREDKTEKNVLFTGDVEQCFQLTDGNKKAVVAKSRSFYRKGTAYCSMLSAPMEITKSGGRTEIKPFEGLKRLRVWKREWGGKKAVSRFEQLFSFCVLPAEWPNITITGPKGGGEDISAGAFEIRLELAAFQGERVRLQVCGYSLLWDSLNGRLKGGPYSLKTEKGRLSCLIYVDRGCCEWICENRVLFLLEQNQEPLASGIDNSVSGNLERCRIWKEPIPGIVLGSEEGRFDIEKLTVYGLRRDGYSPEGAALVKELGTAPPVFYECPEFTVFYDRVRDKNYGWPDAAAVNENTVVSPQRVTEEFVWRDTPWGDMVRAAERGEIWYGTEPLKKYPLLHTKIPVLDASWRIALHTFELCKSSRYAIPGQEGMWAAGLFQGPKESFGVWIRDSAHTAMRTGSLIDPEGAARTLAYAAGRGFDNGADGPAMGLAGCWDYYMATGKKDLLYELRPVLRENILEAQRRFDKGLGLVRAEQSTSNDAFAEPENGGYSLGSECYYMLAFEAAAHIGELLGERKAEAEQWRRYGEVMRRAIRSLYWNPNYGYFTSGPKGSEAYEKGYWETSGEEAAIWPKMGIALPAQRSSVLERLAETAMSAYGIRLFPYRREKNHFCGTVWGVWQAGFASAAAASGNSALLLQLAAQQIRACMMNKTFYEVIDADTGLAWRWPGQLWQAAGFLSLVLYGFFGMEYNQRGLSFHPAVPEKLAGAELSGLRYRSCVLRVKIKGWGNKMEGLYLDGQGCFFIPPDLEGHHTVVIAMLETGD